MTYINELVKALNELGYEVMIGNQNRATYDTREYEPCVLFTLTNTNLLSTGHYNYAKRVQKDPQNPHEYDVPYEYPVKLSYLVELTTRVDSEALREEREEYINSLFNTIYERNFLYKMARKGLSIANNWEGVNFTSRYEQELFHVGSFTLDIYTTKVTSFVTKNLECVHFDTHPLDK